MIKNYFYAFLKRLYYYFFEVKALRDYSKKTLRKRIRNSSVQLQPVNSEQWEIIKERFRGFRVDRKWFDYYNTVYQNQQPEKSYDVTKVIPGTVWYPYVDALFSHPLEAKTMSDKNLTDLLFPDVRRPKTIVRFQDGLFMDCHYRILSQKDAYNRIKQAENVVIKPSFFSGGGRGIVFWDTTIDGEIVFDELFVRGRSFVVQENLKQHERMNALNPCSVNTIRMETFLWKNQVRLLSCLVRMGGTGSKVDNLSSGGMSCGVDPENGNLSPKAYDFYHLNVTYDKHPEGSVSFDGFTIPNWDKCVALAMNNAPKFNRFSKLIAWDIAIGEDGEPVLIECNMMESGCESLQFDNGPVFGDLTDEVLEYVRANRRVRY